MEVKHRLIPPYVLRNVIVPVGMLADRARSVCGSDAVTVDVGVSPSGVISSVDPSRHQDGSVPTSDRGPNYDLRGRHVWTRLADIHTHLDKTQSWDRAPNHDGSFEGAKMAAKRDRTMPWTTGNVYRRMAFGVRCALAHGTRSLRTHLDSQAGRTEPTWEVFEQIRHDFSGHVAIQGVATLGVSKFQGSYGDKVAALARDHRGVLGPVVYGTPEERADIERAFGLAETFGLDLDFHVDETLNAEAGGLGLIMDEMERRQYEGSVVCGHCSSLALKSDEELARTADRAAALGVGIVSLPMTNTYLLGRDSLRTPLYRGLTAVRELKAAGVAVAFASDNCRDAFHPYGDYDMVEVFREAARLGHADLPWGDWVSAISSVPERLMGCAPSSLIEVGAPADLIIFEGRSFSEVLARLGTTRRILARGRELDAEAAQVPSFDELRDV